METSGVCQCANGNQCVWTNYGNQRVNCPCLDPAAGGYKNDPSNTTNFCENIFVSNNCGYETTCNPLINTATCRCINADGTSTTCIYNDSVTLNCPCQTAPASMSDYQTAKANECNTARTANNCPTDPIHCMGGIGTCKCNDGSLCAWGPGYAVNCPCIS